MVFKMVLSIGFILFGLLFGFAFSTRWAPYDADDFFLLIFAFVLVTLGGLMLRFFRNPRVLITSDELFVRGFWRVRRWRLDEIVSIATKREKLNAQRRGGVLVDEPPIVEWIVFELQNGKLDRFIAPKMMSNDRLLVALSMRLGLTIDRDMRLEDEIPLGESPFK